MFGSGRGGICEWFGGLGFGVTNPVGTEGVYDVCQCFGCGVMGVVWGELMDGLGQGLGLVYVCVYYESGFFV